MQCRDRLFKATYPTSPKKQGKISYHHPLGVIPEDAVINIESKEDAAKAVQILFNHDGCYSPKRR